MVGTWVALLSTRSVAIPGTRNERKAALVTESVTQISNLARGINSIKKAYDLIKQYTVFKSAMAAYKAHS